MVMTRTWTFILASLERRQSPWGMAGGNIWELGRPIGKCITRRHPGSLVKGGAETMERSGQIQNVISETK